jgi:endoglucanase Acf2
MAKATSSGSETLMLLTSGEAEAVTEALRYLLMFDSIGTSADTNALRRVFDALSGASWSDGVYTLTDAGREALRGSS